MLSKLLQDHQPVDVAKMRAVKFIEAQLTVERQKLARVEAGSGWARVDACPACGQSAREAELSKHDVALVRCTTCDARYGARIPANLDDVYKHSDYVVFTKEESEEHFRYRRDRFGRERVGILERYCGDLAAKRILDVGCGNGYFLAAAAEKSHYCHGVETNEKSRAFVRERLGIAVYEEGLHALPEMSFDIVTMFDVIEHVPEPMPFLASVDRILAPGGHLLMFTPNFDSFGVRVMGDLSNHVDPTEHVVLYTLPALRRLAERLGYTVVYQETRGLDVASIVALQRHAGEDPDPFLVRWGNEIQAMIDAAGCGDYARIMIRKPG